MTFFEFVSVAISIVLSLSAAQLLGSLRSVFDPARRYWIHELWVVHVLILHVLTWWSGWAFRNVEWNLASFCLVLSVPASLYVATNALVPTAATTSLREHFFANRRSFFAARGLFVVLTMALSAVAFGAPPLAPERLIPMALIGICVIGIVSASPRVHATIAVLALGIVVLGVGYLRFSPGSWIVSQ